MLLRMYLRHAGKRGWSAEILHYADTPAGIRAALVELPAEAVKLAASENGIHRLTRASPFGNGKLHTSFASVQFAQAVPASSNPLPRHLVEESFYRGSGAGGQHRNKTETGVRLRLRQAGLLVEICNERSQKANRDTAWAVMALRWSERERAQAADRRQDDYAAKCGVAFGFQVRTYKLDSSLVRDDRSGRSVRQPQRVLDGDLTPFLAA